MGFVITAINTVPASSVGQAINKMLKGYAEFTTQHRLQRTVKNDFVHLTHDNNLSPSYKPVNKGVAELY
jgi:hypothetical protein